MAGISSGQICLPKAQLLFESRAALICHPRPFPPHRGETKLLSKEPFLVPSHNIMPYKDLDYEELTKTLTDNFNILADEVQLLSDRKTILEHKLRFAHEQVSSTVFHLPSNPLPKPLPLPI